MLLAFTRPAATALLAFAIVCITAVLPSPARAAGAAGAVPADTISAFHATLTDSMSRSAKLGCEGRTRLVQPAVEATFDLPFLAERALRRHWKVLDETQRRRFAAALRSSVISTYATEFAKADAVRFATGATETLANGDALVHSTLTPKDGRAITLDYVMKPRDGGWQVVNVLADGVSDLALRATQYDSLYKAEGFEALMAKLEAQTVKLKARCL